MVQHSQFQVLLLVLICSLAINEIKAVSNDCSNALDLTFVVDSSGSICNNTGVACDNWRSCLALMQNLVSQMTIGTNAVRVALIRFESGATIQWNLTTFSDKPALLDAIHDLWYTGGNTNTVSALDLLSTVYTVERGDRAGERNTAILITDGKPQRGNDPIPLAEIQAAVKRVTDQEIRLLVVGVTDSINMDTLKELSSPPHTIGEAVFLAKDYESIGSVLNQLQNQTCTEETPPPNSPPPDQCTGTFDLCFVVDASGSICDSDEGFNYQANETCNNWNFNVGFIRFIADYFDIGLQATRVGLVLFSTKSYVMWNLTAYTDKPALLNAINGLTYRKGGTTDMTGGVNLMRTQVFGQSDDRPNNQNVAIVITDGFPTNASSLTPEIDALHASGIRTLVVGVTNKTDLGTIKKLASQPPKENENYFLNPDYATLEKNLGSQLGAKTCDGDTTVSTTPQIFIDQSTPTPTRGGELHDPEPCTEPLDLCFVVDASGSICDSDEGFSYQANETCNNWNYNVHFISEVISDFVIGMQDTRVGLVIFSSKSSVKWNLTAFTDKTTLQNAILSLVYRKGGRTDMTGGLNLMRTQVFGQSDDRPNNQNVAIVITDGFPTNASTLPAEIAAVNASGIRTLVVGVTNKTDPDTIRNISSPPQQEGQTYFLVPDYATLVKLRSQLSTRSCGASTPSSTTLVQIIGSQGTPPASSTPPNLITCTEALDLCFVVDASGSICDSDPGFSYVRDETCNNWNYNVQFISDVVSDFAIGLQATRVGLVIFTSQSYVMWNLTAYTDSSSLRNAIQNLVYTKGGTTDMTGGLKLMRTQVYGLSDDRSDSPNTAIVITDGYPTVSSTLQDEIDACNRSGIRTLVVGVTNNTDLYTIKKISSPPQKENVTYFFSASYKTLSQNVKSQLSSETCNTKPFGDVIISSTSTPSAVGPTIPGDGNECDSASLDLCILVDSSGSICDSDKTFVYANDSTCSNWKIIVQFVHKLVDNIFNYPQTTIGLIQFSTRAKTVFNLGRFTDKTELLSAIDNLEYVKGGTTDMTGALRLARTEVFNTAGDRQGFANIEFIITDGYPTEPSTLQGEIDAAVKSNITILALGVTDLVDNSTLYRLSAAPHKINETYFKALDYVDIESFRELLQAKICQ